MPGPDKSKRRSPETPTPVPPSGGGSEYPKMVYRKGADPSLAANQKDVVDEEDEARWSKKFGPHPEEVNDVLPAESVATDEESPDDGVAGDSTSTRSRARARR